MHVPFNHEFQLFFDVHGHTHRLGKPQQATLLLFLKTDSLATHPIVVHCLRMDNSTAGL